MPESELALLDDYFPGVSRMTRHRISREKDFPDPVIIRNKKYYFRREVAAWAETRRRSSAAKVESEAEREAT